MAVLCVVAPAWAAPPGEAAEVLFHEGRELLETHDYEEACNKLERSMKLDSALGTLLLLAYCHEKRGLTATAYGEYLRAEEWAAESGDQDRQTAAREWANALRPRLAMVTVSVQEPVDGMTVEVAGQAVPRSAWGERFPIDPGRHSVVARAPDHSAFETTIVVPPSASSLSVDIPRLEPTAQASPVVEEPGFWETPTPGFIALGVGAVGLGLGGYFGLSAISQNDESEQYCQSDNRCTDRGLELRDDALRDARLSTGFMVIGALGATAGVVLLWPHLAASTTVTDERAVLHLSGRF